MGASDATRTRSVEVETDIPSRLDALPFGRFHLLVIVALGITWILDGLEVTLAGTLSGELTQRSALGLTNSQVGLAGSSYLCGAVLGAFGFGWLTDRWGRKKLFTMTLAVYLAATAATGLSWDAWSYIFFRFLTGAGIGGEYAAVNSTIQELIPARFRGWTDLLINGSFWIGAAMAAGGSTVLLDPHVVDPAFGWRLAFLIGTAIGLIILVMRRWIPESPRWLITHSFKREADTVVEEIEAHFDGSSNLNSDARRRVRLRTRDHTPLRDVAHALFQTYRRRTFVGFALMSAQAFFYNAIFFTYALVLTKFYSVGAGSVGWYILPFALSNFLGPVLLGRLFDTLGRRIMITVTYGLSGVLMIAVAVAFQQDLLSAMGQTIGWMIVFFIASPAASAAYLTVSETFPIEIRAMTIAIFYAIGTGVGGVAAPLIFGKLIESGSRNSIFAGYVFAALLMFAAAVIAWLFAINAERKPLEQVAAPLSAVR